MPAPPVPPHNGATMGTDDDLRSERGRQALAAAERAWQDGRMAEAALAFAAAARLNPGEARAHANLGVVLRRLNRPAAAVAAHRRALALSPDDPGMRSNLGNVLRDLGRLAEAEVELRRAVALAPASRAFTYNLALLLRDARQHAEAETMLEALAASDPADAEVEWDLALTRLYRADYRRGFAGYEARWRLARTPPRQVPGPRWTGAEKVAGRTLLLISEQGFGDAIQFARFVPLVAAQGARVVLECLPELAGLFARLPGVAQIVVKGAPPPPYDLWAPMLSLAHLLGCDWDSLPAAIPTLPPPPPLRPRAAPETLLSVGLVWAGKPTPRDRSWPLETLLPLLEDPRVAVFSLQLGPRAADLAALGVDALVTDLSPRLTSFADSAAVMAGLDLIITIDSAPAHLAGALGRPVWVLLRYVSDWRWRDDGDTSPWYPTMRLFRQPTPDDFATPVAAVKAALAALVAEGTAIRQPTRHMSA